MSMRSGTIVLLLVASAMAVATPASAQPKGLEPGGCPGLYDPVCGRKGKELINYPNACLASNDRAKVLARGPCPQNCPMVYQPVCAEDAQGVRRNYGNECAAKADGAKIIRNRRCFVTFGRH
jgi:hypothetical protein